MRLKRGKRGREQLAMKRKHIRKNEEKDDDKVLLKKGKEIIRKD